MEPVTEKIDGIYISFGPGEYGKITKKLAQWGYEPNGDGVKELLRDLIDEENSPERRVGQALGDFVARNPTVVTNGLAIAQTLTSTLAGKFFGRVKRKGG